MRDTGEEAAFETPSHRSFFLYPVAVEELVVAKGMHVALGALSRAPDAQVHEAALGASARSVFTPRERPDISPSCYGAVFKNLDGHGLEVLTNA